MEIFFYTFSAFLPLLLSLAFNGRICYNELNLISVGKDWQQRMDSNRKELKIAMLGHKRIPSREGGVEIVVEELATRMAAQGHCVTCYNRGGHHVSGEAYDAAHLTAYKGVGLKKVLTIDKKGLAAMTSSFFASLAAAFGPYDVVHYHAEGPCAMMWIPKLFGKRCIATIHGLDWDREKWRHGFGAKYIKFGEKMAVKLADEIIVLSRAVQSYFAKNYGRTTHFIPNGVTRPEKCPPQEITKAYGLKGNDYILFLARLVPEKGLRYLIQAYRKLDTDRKLVIAGGASDSGDFLKELHALAAGDDRILFAGFVQGRMLQELYSNAYLYVLPSDLEGMPLSLLEAMSYGNCCLVSDIPECADVVAEYGVTFRKRDVEDLHDKLKLLCGEELPVRAYKEKAADYICGKYNWDDVVAQTLHLYKETDL